jgi:hypothetical protein
MHHPLDGAKLKVIRAYTHLESVKTEIRMYLDSRPYEMRTYRATDGNDYPNPIATVEPPPIISAVIGDCINAVRAPLDYIAWELASKYFPATIPDDERKWVSFPIYKKPGAKGLSDIIQALEKRGVPTEALSEIKAVQPYNTGYEPLWWLHELANGDKHRMPSLTTGSAGDFFYVDFGAGEWLFPDFCHHLSTDGGESAEPNMKVKAQIPIYVAFEHSAVPQMPADEALTQVVKTVADVITRFEPFF